MAKGRMINKRIAKSDKLAALAKDRHRVIYFMLYPHLDREGRYSADPQDIKEDCCPRIKYSLREISESLNALHDVGLIAIYSINGKQYLEASRFDDFQVGLHKDREAPSEIPPNPGPLPDNSGSFRSGAEKVPLNLKSKFKFNLKDNVGLLPSQIVEYLNQKAGKQFSSTSASTVRHINARIAEGRTLEDFKRVIDIKAASWLQDPKMNAYLRPETLFGSKMESYLQEEVILSREQKDGHVGSRAAFTFTPEQKTRIPEIKKEYQAKLEKIKKEKGLSSIDDIDPFEVPTETEFIRQKLAEPGR